MALLEIVAASETTPSRLILKNIIRLLNLGRKDELIGVLKYEPIKDFIANALEEDPRKRYGVKQLLEHPFVTQHDKSAHNL